jgi:hypothetical protein
MQRASPVSGEVMPTRTQIHNLQKAIKQVNFMRIGHKMAIEMANFLTAVKENSESKQIRDQAFMHSVHEACRLFQNPTVVTAANYYEVLREVDDFNTFRGQTSNVNLIATEDSLIRKIVVSTVKFDSSVLKGVNVAIASSEFNNDIREAFETFEDQRTRIVDMHFATFSVEERTAVNVLSTLSAAEPPARRQQVSP